MSGVYIQKVNPILDGKEIFRLPVNVRAETSDPLPTEPGGGNNKLDQAQFVISVSTTDFDVSAGVTNAWNNVITAKKIIIETTEDIEIKLNNTSGGGFLLPRGSFFEFDNFNFTNLFITTFNKEPTIYLILVGV